MVAGASSWTCGCESNAWSERAVQLGREGRGARGCTVLVRGLLALLSGRRPAAGSRHKTQRSRLRMRRFVRLPVQGFFDLENGGRPPRSLGFCDLFICSTKRSRTEPTRARCVPSFVSATTDSHRRSSLPKRGLASTAPGAGSVADENEASTFQKLSLFANPITGRCTRRDRVDALHGASQNRVNVSPAAMPSASRGSPPFQPVRDNARPVADSCDAEGQRGKSVVFASRSAGGDRFSTGAQRALNASRAGGRDKSFLRTTTLHPNVTRRILSRPPAA